MPAKGPKQHPLGFSDFNEENPAGATKTKAKPDRVSFQPRARPPKTKPSSEEGQGREKTLQVTKTTGRNYGQLPMNYGLLYSIVACDFGFWLWR